MQTIWFITGTSKGLGKALTEMLCGLTDHYVFGLSRSEISSLSNYTHCQIDLSQQQAILDFQFPEISAATRIVLVNNAAQLGEIAPSGYLNEMKIVQTYFLNVVAPYILANKFLQKYREYPVEKVIINISSGAATSPYDGWGLYCSSKAAVQMQSQVMHAEANLHNDSVRVYAYAPGVLNTSMQLEIRSTDSKNFSRKQKFVNLFEEGALVDPHLVALDILKLVENPNLFKDCIYRFPL